MRVQAVDATAEGIRGAQAQMSGLQEPGPKAQFQSTPLTILDPAPFDGKPGCTAGDDIQVHPPPSLPMLNLALTCEVSFDTHLGFLLHIHKVWVFL